MTGILYFSSTGNSLYISKCIQEKIKSKIFYIPTYNGDGSEFDRIIIVSPIYSFGLPYHVYNIIPTLSKHTPVEIVLNYGGMISGADYFTYMHAKNSGLNIRAVYTIKMPENFTLSYTVPKFYLNSILKSAPKRIKKVVNFIDNNTVNIPKSKKTKDKVYFKNKSNWYKIGQDFHVNESCISCGKCISLCPINNISFSNNKIVFGDKCVACLGCYQRCKQKAIQYKDKKKSFRYINPYINENDIGKNI